jgi:chromosome partitioning protein
VLTVAATLECCYRLIDGKLTEVRADYDFILIDCNPAIGQLTMNALIAANYLLIPCVMEPLPMMGIPLLLSRLETDVWDDQPDPKILGVLPTMFDARLTDHRTTLKEMREVLPNVRIFPPVPRTTSYSKASGAGVSLFSAMPEAPGMDSYREVAGAMIEAAFGKRARSGLGAEVTNVK